MWDVRDMGCAGCGMFGMCDVEDVGCRGCGVFGMWDVRDVGCLGCGMWDAGCLPGCGILIYKMPSRERLYPSSSMAYIGVKIDENLNWNNCTYDTATKLNRANALLFKILTLIP